MNEERSGAPGVEPVVPAGVAGTMAGLPLDDPRTLQILTTEHSSLVAARSLSYNEAFTRASMFLTFLSATLVVLGFLVGPLGLSPTLAAIAAVLLAADLFIGLATIGRLLDAGNDDLRCLRGMSRIRHAYVDMVPGLTTYFVTSVHDDQRGVLSTYGHDRPNRLTIVIHGLTTTPGMVGVIDAMIAGALGGVVSLGLGAPPAVAAVVVAVAFVALFGSIARYGQAAALASIAQEDSLFPSPTHEHG